MTRNRLPQNIKNVPLKVSKPLAVRDKIFRAAPKEKLAGVCLSEISELFICLKNYAFNQEACSKEIQLFQNCYDNHVAQFKTSQASFDRKSQSAINQLLQNYSRNNEKKD